MKRIISLLLVSIFFLAYSLPQDLGYAFDVIADLAGPGMHGRGYVSDGEKIASKYISKEFKKHGLKKISNNYFQPFDITVNTFPGEMGLSLNNLKLVPGKDFLVYPGSPSIQGEFETVYFTHEDLVDDSKWLEIIARSTGKFVLLKDPADDPESLSDNNRKKLSEKIEFFQYYSACPAAGTILFTSSKLTWRGSTNEYSSPLFIVKTEVEPALLTKVKVSLESEYFESYETRNVIGMIEGKKYKDSLIFLTAHYDHLGRMGENVYFPGANDNASGIAMILNLAAHYARPENRPDYSLVFLALGAEELGIIGARHFTDNPLLPLENISFLINIDLAGNGEEGITVVNGSVFTGAFNLIKTINDENGFLPVVKKRNPACNSDHCPFYEKGVPSFFIYTMGGSTAYHDIYDTAESLPLTMFENYFRLLEAFINNWQSLNSD